MKTKISLLCAGSSLLVIVSGCTTPELSQTPYSPAESQWAEHIGYSYPGWKAPRTVPPSSTAEAPAAPEQQPAPAPAPTPVDLAPAPLPPLAPAPAPAASKAPEKKKVEAQTYTIQKGDTLSSIAKKMYGKSSKWNVILDANKDKISDAGKLKAGMKINIPAQ